MKALDAEVDWMLGFANNPRLIIAVDSLPSRETLLFEQKGSLYFAEKDGYVSFFAYAQPGGGYGGRHFTINMKDGSVKTLIGPWSSRAGCMNEPFRKCIDVALRVDGYLFSGAVTLEFAKEAVKQFLPDVCLVKLNRYDEGWYIPALKDGRTKPVEINSSNEDTFWMNNPEYE